MNRGVNIFIKSLRYLGLCSVVLLLNGCVRYFPSMMPRLNQTEIGNYPVNCLDQGLTYYDWKMQVRRNRLEKRPQVFMLTNISREPIIIDIYNPHPSASAGWASRIDPQNWSVMRVPKDRFQMTCRLADKDYRKVNCQGRLKACWMPIKLAHKAFRGSGWVSENRGIQEAYYVMNDRGFKLLQTGD